MPGTPTFIIVASAAGAQQLQGWLNTIAGQSVITEAVTLTDSGGNEKGIPANPLMIVESEIFSQILAELRVISQILVTGLNVPDDPATLRNDPTLLT
jgi:hypothetical protein